MNEHTLLLDILENTSPLINNLRNYSLCIQQILETSRLLNFSKTESHFLHILMGLSDKATSIADDTVRTLDVKLTELQHVIESTPRIYYFTEELALEMNNDIRELMQTTWNENIIDWINTCIKSSKLSSGKLHCPLHPSLLFEEPVDIGIKLDPCFPHPGFLILRNHFKQITRTTRRVWMPYAHRYIEIDANICAEDASVARVCKCLRSDLSNSLKTNIGFLKSNVESKRQVIFSLNVNSLQSIIKVTQDTISTIQNTEKMLGDQQFSTTITYVNEMRTSLYTKVRTIRDVQRAKAKVSSKEITHFREGL